MRRTDREVTEHDKMLELLQECDCCRIGLIDGDEVYIVPMNFGFEERDGQLRLYFHGAPEGRKMELLKKTKRVGIELDCRHQLVPGERAGDCTFGYASLIGTAETEIFERPEDKLHGLQLLMKQYTHREIDVSEFPMPLVQRTAVFCLKVTALTCKIRSL